MDTDVGLTSAGQAQSSGRAMRPPDAGVLRGDFAGKELKALPAGWLGLDRQADVDLSVGKWTGRDPSLRLSEPSKVLQHSLGSPGMERARATLVAAQRNRRKATDRGLPVRVLVLASKSTLQSSAACTYPNWRR